jgi:hypothetical protein
MVLSSYRFLAYTTEDDKILARVLAHPGVPQDIVEMPLIVIAVMSLARYYESVTCCHVVFRRIRQPVVHLCHTCSLRLLLARLRGSNTKLWMLVTIMLQSRILPFELLAAVFHLAKVLLLPLKAILSRHVFKADMAMEGTASVRPSELQSTTLVSAIQGVWTL